MVRSRITAILVAIAAIFASVAVSAPAASAATLGTTCSAWNVNSLSGISTRTCLTVSSYSIYHSLANHLEIKNSHPGNVTLYLTQKVSEGPVTRSKTFKLVASARTSTSTTFSTIAPRTTGRAYASTQVNYVYLLLPTQIVTPANRY